MNPPGPVATVYDAMGDRTPADPLREALERIIGMCGDANRCTCGRPTGIPAIVACARTALATKWSPPEPRWQKAQDRMDAKFQSALGHPTESVGKSPEAAGKRRCACCGGSGWED